MEQTNTKIIVCCHKPDIWKSNQIYMPIQGGKAISNIDLGIQGDDTGDNISKKNKSYCELTSIYWAWKNLKGFDYIGLCHYRRYFNFNSNGSMFVDFTPIKSNDFKKLNLTVPDFNKLFGKYDIVLAKPRIYSISIYVDYCICHYSVDVKKIENIIERKYPEYKSSINRLFHETNKISHYNMFIMKWNDFDKYCQWLFDILDEAENEIDITNYNEQQKRIWGYVGERLLLLYIYQNNLNVKYYPVYYINDNVELKSIFHRFQRFVRKSIAFCIMNGHS